jgi:AcrR family transcriptional regulator
VDRGLALPRTANTIKQPDKFKAGAELRKRVVEAASRMFAAEGYESVSVRRIAQLAGCSQMAMYRHFPDKASLITHVCVELYSNQTVRNNQQVAHIASPLKRLLTAGHLSIEMAVKNPHHYRLAFLTPLPVEDARRIRAEVAKPAIDFFRQSLREALPASTPPEVLEARLHQCFACLHGTIVLLITYPQNYGLTHKKALQEFDEMFTRIVED